MQPLVVELFLFPRSTEFGLKVFTQLRIHNMVLLGAGGVALKIVCSLKSLSCRYVTPYASS